MKEYQFCDENGQRYVGVVTQKRGSFPVDFELRPEGTPDIQNALNLLDLAQGLEPQENVQGPKRAPRISP